MKDNGKRDQYSVKLAHLRIYGRDILKMCEECYNMKGDQAKEFILKQFPQESKATAEKLLNAPGLDTAALVKAMMLIRCKQELLCADYKKTIDEFLKCFGNLISCRPSERHPLVGCSIFKKESHNIVSYLPEEGLDAQTQKEHITKESLFYTNFS